MKPTPLATAIASAVATIRNHSLIAVVTDEEPDTTVLTVMTVGVVPGAADNVNVPEESVVNGKLFNVAPLTPQYPL
jgi:hypothetical protein